MGAQEALIPTCSAVVQLLEDEPVILWMTALLALLGLVAWTRLVHGVITNRRFPLDR